jgi:hypothetical protein
LEANDSAQLSPAARRLTTAILLLAALAMFVVHARVYWEWTEDDAFISLRYAQNLAAGHGLAFNPGERVEGYSNFSWVILAAAAIRAGLDPVWTVKLVGLLAGLGCLLVSWALVRQLMPEAGLVALLAPWYLAVSPVLAHHAIAGLESSTFAFLLATSLLLASLQRTALRWRILLVLTLLLLSLTRPEGVGLAALLLVVRGFVQQHTGGSPRAVVVELLVFGALFVLWYAWRWNYFGLPFPNTFYAKAQGGLHSIIDGTQYTLDFLRDGGGPLFFGVGLLPLLLVKPRPAMWMALAVLLADVAFVVIAGGDWMWNYRFYSHVLPVLAALVAAGFALLLAQAATQSWRAVGLYAAVAVVLLLTFLSMGNTELRMARIVLPAVRSHDYLSQNYEELGLWFKENTLPGTSIAISDVGALAYFSERHVVDMFGLNDKHIASMKGRMHYKSDPRYVLTQEPDYIVLVSLNDQGGGYSFQRVPDYAMNALPEFHDRYELIRTVPQNWNNEYALIYKRRTHDKEGESP